MSFTLVKVALFATLAIQGAFAAFAISSPALKQCETANISWASSKGPYNLIIVDANAPCGDALVDLGDFTGTVTTWKTTLAAGKKVQLSLVDANDQEAWSKNITIAASDDSSCLKDATAALASSSSSTTSSADSTATSGAPAVDPLGAANAGSNTFFNGSLSSAQVSKPILALAGLAAALVLSF